jgi:transposase
VGNGEATVTVVAPAGLGLGSIRDVTATRPTSSGHYIGACICVPVTTQPAPAMPVLRMWSKPSLWATAATVRMYVLACCLAITTYGSCCFSVEAVFRQVEESVSLVKSCIKGVPLVFCMHIRRVVFVWTERKLSLAGRNGTDHLPHTRQHTRWTRFDVRNDRVIGPGPRPSSKMMGRVVSPYPSSSSPPWCYSAIDATRAPSLVPIRKYYVQ